MLSRMHLVSQRTSHGDHRAFSLIELLVAMLVLGVLLALVVPVLGKARQRQTELRCQTNMRSAGQLLLVYAADHRDHFPYAGDTPRAPEWVPDPRIDQVVGGRIGHGVGMWAMLFREHWSGIRWSRSLRCPKQIDWTGASEDERPFNPGAYIMPQYLLSQALWLDAGTLTDSTPFRDHRPRANSVSEVVSPSKKSVLFEHAAFCADDEDARYWYPLIGTTQLSPTSLFMVDGSVRRMKRTDGLMSCGNTPPFQWTVDGIRGRDIR